MKDLLAKLAELDKDIKTINETTNPLGETASMNISMTGDNADEVAQLVNIMRTGNTQMPSKLAQWICHPQIICQWTKHLAL